MNKNGNLVENLLTIIIIGFFCLLFVPILFATDNPITDSNGTYFHNSYNTILYALSTYILFVIPFMLKINVFKTLISMVVGCWSLVGLYYELLNWQYPEVVLNNPFDLANPMRVALFFVSLALILIFRYKWLKPDFK